MLTRVEPEVTTPSDDESVSDSDDNESSDNDLVYAARISDIDENIAILNDEVSCTRDFRIPVSTCSVRKAR